jgi:TRAP-type C4-dicarboxylate transport system permease small subunit
MENLIKGYESFYRRFIPFLIAVPLVIMTVVITINVIGRKLSMPFPVTVELVEALLVVSVYFGVALVALEGGHVNVTFATDRLGPKTRFFIEGMGHLLAAIAFVYLSLSAWSIAQASSRLKRACLCTRGSKGMLRRRKASMRVLFVKFVTLSILGSKRRCSGASSLP